MQWSLIPAWPPHAFQISKPYPLIGPVPVGTIMNLLILLPFIFLLFIFLFLGGLNTVPFWAHAMQSFFYDF